jgi:hypothetical protein
MDGTYRIIKNLKQMKNILGIIFFYLQTTFLLGQLNPINNLNWEHIYVNPYNYFSLTWEAPDQSIDSLVGYNIYAGDSLYKFQNYIGAHCQEFDQTDCDFIYSFLSAGDYIKVTAV